MNRSAIIDRFHALMSEGVRFFPPEVVQAWTAQDDDVSADVSTQKHVETSVVYDMRKCTSCALSSSRKRVVVAPLCEPRRFFVLADFPEGADEEEHNALFSEKSPAGIILKLMAKLGIEKESYFSFALKCVPEKGIPAGALSSCALKNLKYEMKQVAPRVIFCFGHRALEALSFLFSNLKSRTWQENETWAEEVWDGLPVRIYFLSDSRALRDYPQWRASAWKLSSMALESVDQKPVL